jgi:4'-phosphopantetheinyl transferase
MKLVGRNIDLPDLWQRICGICFNICLANRFQIRAHGTDNHSRTTTLGNMETARGSGFEVSRSSSPQMKIEPTVHLYCGLLDTVDTPAARSVSMATLSRAEKQRVGRCTHEFKQRQYVLAHGLVRAALSRVEPAVDAADWIFHINRYGRPLIVGPVGTRQLHFSMSHTEGCIACAISPCEAVGVDVEKIGRTVSVLAIAETWFSAVEVAALRALPPAEQTDRFFDNWTLKEAYLKARGMGLNLPLDQFSISVQPGHNIRIEFAPGFEDVPTRWHFTRGRPSQLHRLAIADGSGVPGGLPIVTEPWPLP